MMEIKINENEVRLAAAEGMDAFVMLFYNRIMETIGGELTSENMSLLQPDQITLLAYVIMREEVMDGGFIQLIHNGYGPFIFLNPFAKAMNQWGARDFRNLIYKGRKLYELYSDELTKECTDEEFMALFEQYPEFDDLDDEFVECEEEITELVARYIDEHIDNFATILKD
ncbi:MAG: DMP19 family protein, partial [Bacteroidaceae bacterium]|nr:DMP19 family protein [Bacteroidaceae bacterium]